MPTQIAISLGENLAETLDIGNYTTDGQKIKALNGTSSLNLRLANNNEIVLTNDDVTFLLAYLALFPTVAQLGFGPQFYIEVSQLASAFRVNSANAYVTLDLSAIQHQDISNNNIGDVHALKLINITASDIESITTDQAAMFLHTGSDITPSVILQNVIRTICASGKGLTAKTNDTFYLNQISFQEATILFDCILKSGTITADRVITLPDKSGELIIDQYFEKWTLYNATLDATWETITITDALPNSIIEITMENNSAVVRDMGIRAVGSALNRFVTSIGATTLTVRTNSSKEVQLYASVAANIDFHFSAQL